MSSSPPTSRSNSEVAMDTHQQIGAWPDDSVARVPYWVYQDEANYRRELERLALAVNTSLRRFFASVQLQLVDLQKKQPFIVLRSQELFLIKRIL